MNTFAVFLKNEDQDLYENFDWETFFESEEFENSQEYKEPVDGIWNSLQDAYYFNVTGLSSGGRATIAPLDLSQSNFTVAFSSLRKIEQTTESVTFKTFLRNIKC